MKAKPILVKSESPGLELERINPREKNFSEGWLQDLLDKNPQILPTDEIEEVFSPIASIGRELATEVGYIDNLFISSFGYPVIVETKLWRNSEAKREVVAQIIDYAATFSKWTFTHLDEVCKQKTQKGILDFIQDSFDLDPEEMPDEDQIAKNLRQGRFLLLIVGDKIRNSLVDMLGYINQYPALSTNIGMIELQMYQVPNTENDILVVPNIVAKTEIVERSVVQVNLNPNLEHQISVEQRKYSAEDGGKRKPKQILSDDAFWEIFEQNVSSYEGVEKAKKIYSHFDLSPEIDMINRQTALVTRFTVPETGKKISLFYINKDGTLSCQFSNVRGKLMDMGYPSNFSDSYYKFLATVLNDDPSKKNIKQEANQINQQEFIQVVEEFIQKIHTTDIQIDEE